MELSKPSWQFLLIILFAFQNYYSQNFELKSVRVYGAGNEASFPMAPIDIEFDVEANHRPDLEIIFKFCDENWNVYENLMLQNLGYDKDYQLFFEELPVTVRGADYHFKKRYPNKNVSFPYSGKWKFFVVDKFDESKIYESGKFYSVDSKFALTVNSQKERLYKENEAENTEGRAIRLETSFSLPEDLFPHLVDHIEIVENRMLNYPIIINTGDFDNLQYCDFDGGNRYTFVIRDLYPGNNYRTTDFRNHKRFIGPEVDADIDKFETENYYHLRPPDLNGGSQLMAYDNNWADYLKVNFTLRPDTEEDDRIFLIGAFNNWKLSEDFEMIGNDGLFTFQTELKRGRYDYQYVVYRGEEYFDWYFLEGNFYETSNEYNIFVFYNSEDNGGFSEIVAYKNIEIVNGKITSRTNRGGASRKNSLKTVKGNFKR